MARTYREATKRVPGRVTFRDVMGLNLITHDDWLFIYSRDLPDISHLAQFASSAESQVSDFCLDMPSVAIPFDQIGKTLRAEYAVLVAAVD